MSLFQAEQDLRAAQSEFDRQAEVTRLLLEGISSTHVCQLTTLPHTLTLTLLVFRFIQHNVEGE